jgi:hypothetical protein
MQITHFNYAPIKQDEPANILTDSSFFQVNPKKQPAAQTHLQAAPTAHSPTI